MTDLDAIKAALEKAHTEVGEICRRTGAGRWRMSIPAQPDRDSDLIISDALRHADELLAEVARLRSRVEELTALLNDGARLTEHMRKLAAFDKRLRVLDSEVAR